MEKLLLLKPSFKVIFMSGYTDDAILRHGVINTGLTLIQKPFTAAELLRRVRATLDGAEGAHVQTDD